MENTIVVYQSKYGSTKKYAEWISEELSCPSCEASKTDLNELMKYENIIFGGGLYAGGINGVSIITKNFDKLKDKKLSVFTVGLSSTKDTSIFKHAITKNFKEEMLPYIHFFHLRGGMDYSKLSLIHRPMMAMMKKSVEKKGEANYTEDDKLMISTYGGFVDFADRSTIKPILDYINEL